jgi:hypothetical protein
VVEASVEGGRSGVVEADVGGGRARRQPFSASEVANWVVEGGGGRQRQCG